MSKRYQYESARREFRSCVVSLLGEIDAVLPAAAARGIPASGLSIEEPLRTIARQMDDTLATFDLLQVALGVPGAETRHRRFLRNEK